jgi:hypothetical protein
MRDKPPRGWKKETVRIRFAPSGEWRRRVAWKRGLFAIHPTQTLNHPAGPWRKGDHYTLTHIPTGYAILMFLPLKATLDGARNLGPAYDWSKIKEQADAQKVPQRVLKIRARIINAYEDKTFGGSYAP